MNRLIIIFLLLSFHLSAQDQKLEKYIDSLMLPVNRKEMPASYLIIARDGKPLVRRAFGSANLEMGVPAVPEHLFTLASVNKQMIAVCILQLAHHGKLKLTDDIRTHLPSFDTHGKLISVEQLLDHTSGIYSANGPVRGKSLFYDKAAEAGILSDAEFIASMMQPPLLFDPGTDWSWNTWGYHVAAFIVEVVSGMPLNEYFQKNLFQPAGMTNSFSKVDGNRLGLNGIKNLNTSFYYPDADGKWVWRDTRRLTPYSFYQRYSVVTCLDDLVKWDVALREGKLVTTELLDKAWTSTRLKNGTPTNYGLGWVVSEQNGYKLKSHIGIGTNPICVVHVPSEKLYVAYTQFFGTYGQTETRVKKILTRLLPLTYPSVSRTDAPVTDYIGTYEIHRTGLDIAPQISELPVYIRVTTSGDTLFLKQTASDKIILRPAGRDRFLPVGSENTWYVFNRDGKNVNSISTLGSYWTYGPEVRNKKVNKTWPDPVVAKEVSAKVLNKYVGTYYMSALESYIYIDTNGTKLYNLVQGRRQELIPVADNKFVRKGVEDVSFEFKSNTDGSMVLNYFGLRPLDYRKIN